MKRGGLVVIIVAALAIYLTAQEPRWFSAWTAAHNVGLVVDGLNGGSVRAIVRPTISGRSLRIKFANTRGTTPAVFSAAFVGVSATGAALVPGTSRRLTFDGTSRLALAPEASAWSDPVAFDVTAFQRLAISVDIESASDVSMDTLALVTTYRAAGHHAADTTADAFSPIPPNAPGSTTHEFPMYWLAAVDVLSPSTTGTIVAVGDSWVDGRCSTTEGGRVRPDLYLRWIDLLATRLTARPGVSIAVVNAGIAGNRIIPGGGNGPPLSQRLDGDVLERAGVTHVLLLQGMNDIGRGATAGQITAAMHEVVDRVHARGVKIIAGTLFPMARPDRAGWSPAMEAQRLAVNDWIRAKAPFDAVIDFDALMRGGPVYGGSQSLKAEFACDDDVHPNTAGHRAMGEFVDLALLAPSVRRR